MEKTELAERNEMPEKPRKFWDGALKMVKGENPTQLMENFTADMTLVAEGLCEDQAKLRREMDHMMTEEDRRIQSLGTKIDAIETMLDDERTARDRDLTEMRNRLAAVEKKTDKEPLKEKPKRGNIIKDLTVLVAIAAGAWVIVTLLNKLL